MNPSAFISRLFSSRYFELLARYQPCFFVDDKKVKEVAEENVTTHSADTAPDSTPPPVPVGLELYIQMSGLHFSGDESGP